MRWRNRSVHGFIWNVKTKLFLCIQFKTQSELLVVRGCGRPPGGQPWPGYMLPRAQAWAFQAPLAMVSAPGIAWLVDSIEPTLHCLNRGSDECELP